VELFFKGITLLLSCDDLIWFSVVVGFLFCFSARVVGKQHKTKIDIAIRISKDKIIVVVVASMYSLFRLVCLH
jgi:hypothetical protein